MDEEAWASVLELCGEALRSDLTAELGDDITRGVLLQLVAEQERGGRPVLRAGRSDAATTGDPTPQRCHTETVVVEPAEMLTVDDDPIALMDAYAERGWGDGLPLIPPTSARVDAMLAALGDVDPDEVIAVLPPRDGEATRRMIAVNAVLAGCAPDQMPVLVSAVRAIAHDETISPGFISDLRRKLNSAYEYAK